MLDIAACAKCCGARIGEAANPGRAPKRGSRAPGALAKVQLLEPQTVEVREKYWNAFIGYLKDLLCADDVQAVLQVPSLLASFVAAYAAVMLDAGVPLHYYRQLVAHVQRSDPGVRPYLRTAWDQVSRWEILEPVQHQPPLPIAILKAMISLAICWKWTRWAAVTLVAFFGICRIGEVLKAVRADFLLPSDLLESGTRIYLRIREPKTKRPGARIQHATIPASPELCKFLAAVLGPLDARLPLYGGSPAMYRRRWDKLLARLRSPVLFALHLDLSGEEGQCSPTSKGSLFPIYYGG